MWAAAEGKSTLGIPEKVGKDFAAADPGGHLPKTVKMKDGGVVPDKSKVSDKWGVDLTTPDRTKVSDKWGVDLTKWANESDADKMDDAVRNEGNLQAKAALEAKREAMVDAGQPQPQPKGMKHGGRVPGKGSGDHVAALLEPGELVVPKKDAEKMFKPRNTWTEDEDDDGE